MSSVQFVPIIGSSLAAAVLLMGSLRQNEKIAAPLWERQLSIAQRFITVLAISWFLFLYLSTAYSYSDTQAALSELMRNLGLSALLFVALVRVPTLTQRFAAGSWADRWAVVLRRPSSMAALCYGIAHAVIGFSHNLAAQVSVIGYLSLKHRIAVLCGLTLLLCMLLLWCSAFVSNRWNWARHVRATIVRISGIFVVLGGLHSLLIGSDLTSVRGNLSIIILTLSLCVVLLEVCYALLWLLRGRTWMALRVSLSVLLLALLLITPIALRTSLVRLAESELQAEREGKGHRH